MKIFIVAVFMSALGFGNHGGGHSLDISIFGDGNHGGGYTEEIQGNNGGG